jgi:hypothetical protein
MFTPGAPRSTESRPRLLKGRRPPVLSTAATDTTLASENEAGYCGTRSLFAPSLPAAATSTAGERAMACSSVWLRVGEPKLALMTAAPSADA